MRSSTEAGSPVRKCRSQSEFHHRAVTINVMCPIHDLIPKQAYAEQSDGRRMPKESMPARQAKQLVLDMCQINANPR